MVCSGDCRGLIDCQHPNGSLPNVRTELRNTPADNTRSIAGLMNDRRFMTSEKPQDLWMYDLEGLDAPLAQLDRAHPQIASS